MITDKKLINSLEKSWALQIKKYCLSILQCDNNEALILVSKNSVIVLAYHNSIPGVDLRWLVRKNKVWRSYSAYNLVWKRSPNKTIIKVDDESLEYELDVIISKLEEAGKDMLSGEIEWTKEYENIFGPPININFRNYNNALNSIL